MALSGGAAGFPWTRRPRAAGQRRRGDGQEIVCEDEGGTVFAVDLTFAGGGVRIGPPRKLFDHGGVKSSGPLNDLQADGQGLVATDPPRLCDLVLNWPAKLAVQSGASSR